MSGFGFVPNEGFFNAGTAGAEGAPMLQPAVMRDAARKFLATHNDLPIGQADAKKAQEAIDIANTWIDQHTQFPVTAATADVAWSRKDWIDHSVAGWQKLVEPLAEGMVEALGKVLKEMGQQTLDPESSSVLNVYTSPQTNKRINPSESDSVFSNEKIKSGHESNQDLNTDSFSNHQTLMNPRQLDVHVYIFTSVKSNKSNFVATKDFFNPILL